MHRKQLAAALLKTLYRIATGIMILTCQPAQSTCLQPGQGCTPSSQCCGPVNQCRSGICCNYVNGACNAEVDCCSPGNECNLSTGLCKITSGYGSCNTASDCASGSCMGGICQYSTSNNPCLHNVDCATLSGHSITCLNVSGSMKCCGWANDYCEKDLDCCNGNECNTTLKQCKILSGDSFCQVDSDCATSDCGPTGVCQIGQPQDPCIHDADCAAVRGHQIKCRNSAGNNKCCNYVNDYCLDNSECCAGNECDTNTSTCKILSGFGACHVNGDCGSNACAHSTCSFSGLGGACLSDADCNQQLQLRCRGGICDS